MNDTWDHPTLTREQFIARMDQLEAQESQDPEAWYWCSFADDDGFRGVAIVRASGVLSASQEARRRGINPGGEVLAFPLDPEHEPGEFANRLLTKDEAEAASMYFSGEGISRLDESK